MKKIKIQQPPVIVDDLIKTQAGSLIFKRLRYKFNMTLPVILMFVSVVFIVLGTLMAVFC